MRFTENRFVLLWFCSATVVTLARVLHAVDLGYDLTIQIQAAQNLLAGNGLAIYSVSGEDDLAKCNHLVTLTYFPSGYSFCAAALIALGLSVGTVVKACGAAGTILGWWGWAKLAYSFFEEAFERGRVWRIAGALIAICSPLLFTPPWHGTDIFLWAAIPWVLGWLVRASDESNSGGRWLDALAGVACGFCVLMRYAGVFLAVYAVFLIFLQSKKSIRMLARRWAVFALALLPLLTFQLYLNQFGSIVENTPGGVTLERGVWAGVTLLGKAFRWLTTANFPVVWWMPHTVVRFLTRPSDHAPWLLVVTGAVLALPLLLAAKLASRGLTPASRDIRIAAAGLFVAFPLLLWGCAMLGAFYVAAPRYYSPLLPLAVFVAYAFALGRREKRSKMQELLRVTSIGYLSTYICMAAVSVALLMAPGERGSNKRANLIGTRDLHQWPSMKMTYDFSPARSYVLALLKEEPGIVLVTNCESWFYADPSVDRSRLHRLLDLRATYVSGPAHILLVAADPGNVPGEALYVFTENEKPRRVDYFDQLGFRLLRRFPEENLRILEAVIPDGSQIALNRRAAE